MRVFLALFLIGAPLPAMAQLTLPGATAPAPLGSVVAPAPGPAKRHPAVAHAAAAVAPVAAGLAAQTVFLNGGKSQMAFSPRDKTVELSRLLLSGTKLSNRQDACQVDLAGMPLALTPLAATDGLERFSLPIPACPITLEVLDGAVLATSEAPKCAFKEADCEVPIDGLWGAAPGDLGPDRVKTIERERTQAEASVRAAYKGLIASTKDRAVIRGFASDQAGFSSHREETCRDYVGEARHGFCGARLTQARALTLQAQLAVAAASKEGRKKRQADARHK